MSTTDITLTPEEIRAETKAAKKLYKDEEWLREEYPVFEDFLQKQFNDALRWKKAKTDPAEEDALIKELAELLWS